MSILDPDSRPARDSDLTLALELADTADRITLARFQAADLRVDRKPDRTPVTDADTATEDALRAVLTTRRPEDAVLGEERGLAPGTPAPGSTTAGSRERSWILDPIDGTKNFSRGMPVWATLIALTEGGRPTVGVVSAPALGRRWWASAGGGAFAGNPANPDHPAGATRRISVSRVSHLSDACLSTTELSTWAELGALPRYLDLAGRCWVVRAFGDFWQHVLVAEGAIDLGIDGEANAWDLAAVQLIVTEAGGRFSDLAGVARFDGGSGVSSNGLLHDAALAVLKG
ncbi:MAG TPA: inositol monophosphatase family protein [Pseudonocardia sp.]|uniref:inositol monophosphatase family protein n=1 Tax=Pseudonocardia sp. TaxID=60912 RepID=UPI002CA038BC|nr:inositol monophosphatase family protein [Pseudonocardia sp.]HTF52590.1 inositol monophosphatase family protein [Pseudonocardia sp.]